MEDREFLRRLSGIGKLTAAQRIDALGLLSEAARVVMEARVYGDIIPRVYGDMIPINALLKPSEESV